MCIRDRVQSAIAGMIMNAPSKHKAHSEFSGYATYEASKLDEKFGRGVFSDINANIRIFDVVEDEQGRHAYSFRKGHTKGYRLRDEVLSILDDYLKGNKYRRVIIENLAGEVASVPANALASRRKEPKGKGPDGKPKVPQPKVGFKVKVLAAVPVNKSELLKLIHELEKIIFSLEHGIYQESLLHPQPDMQKLKSLWRSANHILGLANNTNPGMSRALVHRYEQSNSGRWYAQDTNFQNTHSLIRMVALHGHYDYDIENCHYAILDQLAATYRYQCRAIRRYLNHKDGIRHGLMDRLGITKSKAKKCLISLVYGAKFSLREDEEGEPLDAIAKTLGSLDLARQLFSRRMFKALKDDIAGARKAILDNYPVNRQGAIVNAMGLPMTKAGTDTRKLLAHLLPVSYTHLTLPTSDLV